MKPKFAVQVTSVHDDEIHRIVNALKAIDADYATFGLIPFSDEITNIEAFENAKVVIPLGSTKLVSMYQRYKLPDHWRVFYSQMMLDQLYARAFLGGELLNALAWIEPFSAVRTMQFEKPMFVKPTNDLKLFGGLVLEPGQTLDDALRKTMHQEIHDHEAIMVAHPQQLGREFRLAIVDDHIVGISQYRDRGHLSARELSLEEVDMLLGESIYTYFEKLRDFDLPAPRAYAMDICEVLTDDGPQWRVVECNCFNACGLYAMDRTHVYKAIIRHVERVYG